VRRRKPSEGTEHMPVAAVAVAGLAIGGAGGGATVAAVASVTGSKPLQIAGTVLGVMGDVGALASDTEVTSHAGVTSVRAIAVNLNDHRTISYRAKIFVRPTVVAQSLEAGPSNSLFDTTRKDSSLPSTRTERAGQPILTAN
jgi:hypothetical protein